jgi:hypothetical protein
MAAPARIGINEVGVLHHSQRLFERPYDRLNSTDRITVEFWRDCLPLVKEVYDFSQRVGQLYRREISSEVAKTLLNQWLDGLSPDAMRSVCPFAPTLRKYMPNVCAYSVTGFAPPTDPPRRLPASGAHPLAGILSPVIEELQENPAPDNFREYLRIKPRMATQKPPAEAQKNTFLDDH